MHRKEGVGAQLGEVLQHVQHLRKQKVGDGVSWQATKPAGRSLCRQGDFSAWRYLAIEQKPRLFSPNAVPASVSVFVLELRGEPHDVAMFGKVKTRAKIRQSEWITLKCRHS